MNNPLRTPAMIALTAASLFAASCSKKDETKPAATESKPADKDKAATPDEKTAKVHCLGINECKGKSGCKTATNACAGQNGCKGKGFADVATEEECKTKGGTVTAGM